jgi:hypothetical protein
LVKERNEEFSVLQNKKNRLSKFETTREKTLTDVKEREEERQAKEEELLRELVGCH